MKKWAFALLFFVTGAMAAPTVHVYGPGGPAPAMKAAAAAYEKASGVQVVVQAGPTPKWENAARQNADMIYSGSEAMMSDFCKLFGEQIVPETVVPVYLRPAAILVRRGNPRNIQGVADLVGKKVKILVTHGAGQVGMWEDIAGRLGNIGTVRAFRENIAFFAPNTGVARQTWLDDGSFDAWLVFNIWGIANPGDGEIVALEPEYRVYRPMDIALTREGQKNGAAAGFYRFISSKEGRAIFEKYGWMENAATDKP